jgi:membrane protein YdbS with pleckstrin-like domain
MARSVRIQHNGQQLGPYSVEEAQRMVLAGEIPPGTVSQIDNSGEWRPLHQQPDFVARPVSVQPAMPAVVTASGAVPVTAVGTAAPVSAGEETTLWSGSPSQILNFKILVGWIVLLGLAGAMLYFLDRIPAWTEKVSRPQAMMGFGALAVVALIHYAVAALSLRSTHYLVTNQRVRVTRGLLGKNMQEIELFRVKDTAARQTFFRRLFGVGDLDIVSGDANNPNLHLVAVPNALELRESIRREVLALRQRFGVRELDVM